jgi:hypothetical protein
MFYPRGRSTREVLEVFALNCGGAACFDAAAHNFVRERRGQWPVDGLAVDSLE